MRVDAGKHALERRRRGVPSHDGRSDAAGSPEPVAPPGLEDRLRRLAVLAGRVRAKLLFMLLDAACVVGAYSAAEVFYWRHVAPSQYGWHFGIFLVIVVMVTLVSNRIFGLYGRLWRHAG